MSAATAVMGAKATPEPAEPAVSLFDRLGGEAAVEAAVDIFYTKVTTDPELVRFFEGIDMKKLRGHQTKFLTMAFGGPGRYTGRSMELAHKKLIENKGLNNTHFDLVAGHLVATLQQLKVSQALIDEVTPIVMSLRGAFPEPKA